MQYGSKTKQSACMHSKDWRLRRASHSGEIGLAGSRRLRAMLAAVLVVFAHAVVTVAENK